MPDLLVEKDLKVLDLAVRLLELLRRCITMNGRIKKIYAQQVYTRRGHPGVEAVVITEGGFEGRAVCTSGVSIGSHEIPFKFDDTGKFGGKGVMNAVDNVNNIIGPKLIGMNTADQLAIDSAMLAIMPDAKLNLGGNATAAVSAAALKAGALSLEIPLYQHIGGVNAMYLPVPGIITLVGSDRFGGGITTPGGKPSYSIMLYDFKSFEEASYAGWEISNVWRNAVKSKYGIDSSMDGVILIGPGHVSSDEELWALMAESIAKAGYEGRAGIQVDVATDTYHNKEDDLYYGLFDNKPKSKEDLMNLYLYMADNYPFVIYEDPFNEDDYENTAELTKRVGIQITGDDLFTTNPERVSYGISKGAATTVLLKVNQVGTISEALEMVHYAYRFGYSVMPCESRGEGAAIADYSVGINAKTVRESALGDSANRFIEIERELGSRAKFAGTDGLMGPKNKARIKK